jgi:Flp pilus assembly protein TadD
MPPASRALLVLLCAAAIAATACQADPVKQLAEARRLQDTNHPDEAMQIVDGVLAKDPALFDARLLKATLVGAVPGREEEALGMLRQLAQAEPRKTGVHRAMGVILARTGKFGPAVNQFEKELARNPADAETLTDLGLFYLQTGQIEQAADRLQRAATVPQAPARAHRYYAEILFKQGRNEEGLDEQRKAIALAPRDVDLIISHARALQGFAHADEAPGVLHAAIDRGVTNPRLYVELARQEREALNYDAAVAWLRKAIALDDSLAEAQIDLGKIYLYQGRRDEARAAFEHAVTAAPTDAYAPFYLATILMEDGKFAEAEPLLRRSVELDPLNPKAHYTLGQALQRLGRDDEAQSELAKHAEILKRLRESKQTAGPATAAD